MVFLNEAGIKAGSEFHGSDPATPLAECVHACRLELLEGGGFHDQQQIPSHCAYQMHV